MSTDDAIGRCVSASEVREYTAALQGRIPLPLPFLVSALPPFLTLIFLLSFSPPPSLPPLLLLLPSPPVYCLALPPGAAKKYENIYSLLPLSLFVLVSAT